MHVVWDTAMVSKAFSKSTGDVARRNTVARQGKSESLVGSPYLRTNHCPLQDGRGYE